MPYHFAINTPQPFEYKALSAESASSRPPLERLELLVAREFSISLIQLRAQTRGMARTARARQVAVYLAHVVLGCSLTSLARYFTRDRTTIAHACRVIEDARDDLLFDQKLARLEREVQNLFNLAPNPLV